MVEHLKPATISFLNEINLLNKETLLCPTCGLRYHYSLSRCVRCGENNPIYKKYYITGGGKK